jgi:hypothetical protein
MTHKGVVHSKYISNYMFRFMNRSSSLKLMKNDLRDV